MVVLASDDPGFMTGAGPSILRQGASMMANGGD
jgi:hypothetical protein